MRSYDLPRSPTISHDEMTTPLLKLYAELVYNKAQRLTFDSSSPNGILLFRVNLLSPSLTFSHLLSPSLTFSNLLSPF